MIRPIYRNRHKTLDFSALYFREREKAKYLENSGKYIAKSHAYKLIL